MSRTFAAFWARPAGAHALAAGLVLLAGCAARAPLPTGETVEDPVALEAEIRRATTPTAPRQATFAWSLDESGSRARGRGVVRVAAPERLRLDLFGPRGESYLAAALVDGEYRLPRAVARESVALPSPALFWATLGILRPPAGAVPEATRDSGLVVLEYPLGAGERLRYRVAGVDAAPRLEQVERIGPSGVLETIWLEYSPEGTVRRTRYRDWTAYRELVFETETITDVPPFDESIWNPGGADR